MNNILLTTLLLTQLFFPRAKQADQILLDGVLGEKEWAAAQKHTLSGGQQLLTQKKGNELYLAIKGSGSGWAHVYVQSGEKVRILHASAALGLQEYEKGVKWKMKSGFSWALRDTVYNTALKEAQEKYFRENDWCANNNLMNKAGNLEFRLRVNKGDRIAVVLAHGPAPFSFFPATLSDDTILQALVYGRSVEEANFDPSSWYAKWTEF